MDERADFRTRFTNRLNVAVWALPAPRRLKALLSRLVYKNPPMPVADVLRVLEALDKAGIDTIVMGGWGIDALVGEQQRVHHDLDLIVCDKGLYAALSALAGLGYSEWFRDTEPAPYGEHGIEGAVIVLRDAALRVVDLHPMRIGDCGPAATAGEIAGRPVHCVSAELQVEAHSGYRKRWPSERRRQEANLATARRALESRERRVGASGSGALSQQRRDLI